MNFACDGLFVVPDFAGRAYVYNVHMSAYRVDTDLLVDMRDGVQLATDVYFPAPSAGPSPPVLLYRTPYGKDEMAATWGFASWFAEHGYIVVQQDVRGCYKSGGRTDFLRPESSDGVDTLRWISRQPWGSVDVGSWGTSWSGWTQTAMAALAAEGPSRLRTIVPMMCGADAWSSSVRHGGALELRWIAWAFWHAAENDRRSLGKTADVETALLHPAHPFREWLGRWPLRRGSTQLALVPEYEAWAMDLLEHEERDAYWAHGGFTPAALLAAAQDLSALYIGSWYDSYARGTVELFQSHRQDRQARLLMGPWLHGTQTVQQGTAGGISLGPDAALPDYKQCLLAWFDRTLRSSQSLDAETAYRLPTDDRPVRIFVMGGGSGGRDAAGRLEHGGRWRNEHEWPLARTEARPLYLHVGGSLGNVAPTVHDMSRQFVYDPSDPVPTIGGGISSMSEVPIDAPSVEVYHSLPHAQRIASIVPPGGFDQRTTASTFQLRPRVGPLADRTDVLVFETPPLAAPLEVTGSAHVHLFVSTDALDTDFTAKLLDVYPPSQDWPEGFALNLTDSIVRLRFRDGTGLAQPVRPGVVYEIDIQLYPTSNLFATGHRIRLDVSSSNFPRFDRNPNTGESPHVATTIRVAVNRIFCDAERTSKIVLPVIPCEDD